MSRVKVNKIDPFSGANITLGGNAIPSGSGKTLGTETSYWDSIYVGEESVNFVSGSSTGSVIIASIKAYGENGVSGGFKGQIFTDTSLNRRGSFSVGKDNIASGTASLTNGLINTASGNYSHAEGYNTIASGLYSHAEGQYAVAFGGASHAEGQYTVASGAYAHSEGYQTIARGDYSHAEGYTTLASGQGSHTEGISTTASGLYSHAEGQATLASGQGSHAEGISTTASGLYSHAEGSLTVARGDYSHAEGLGTIASGSYQTVVGEYNALGDTTSHFIVGGGVSGSRKDAFKVTHSSSIVVATQSAVPSWTGTEGEMVPYVSGSTYRLYAYLGGTWRSSSFV
jgi:hypothetical protein